MPDTCGARPAERLVASALASLFRRHCECFGFTLQPSVTSFGREVQARSRWRYYGHRVGEDGAATRVTAAPMFAVPRRLDRRRTDGENTSRVVDLLVEWVRTGGPQPSRRTSCVGPCSQPRTARCDGASAEAAAGGTRGHGARRCRETLIGAPSPRTSGLRRFRGSSCEDVVDHPQCADKCQQRSCLPIWQARQPLIGSRGVPGHPHRHGAGASPCEDAIRLFCPVAREIMLRFWGDILGETVSRNIDYPLNALPMQSYSRHSSSVRLEIGRRSPALVIRGHLHYLVLYSKTSGF